MAEQRHANRLVGGVEVRHSNWTPPPHAAPREFMRGYGYVFQVVIDGTERTATCVGADSGTRGQPTLQLVLPDGEVVDAVMTWLPEGGK